MTDIRFRSFEELERYLREFINWRGESVPYDVVGAFTLWRAMLANLKERSLKQEVADYAETLSEEEIRFLEQLIAEAKRGR